MSPSLIPQDITNIFNIGGVSLYSSVFLVGLMYGLTTCSLSCMPLLGTYIMGTKNTFKGGLNASFIFTVSRIAGYTAIGLLCGLLGHVGKELFPARAVMITGGILILLIGINVCRPGGNPVCCKKKFSGLKRTPFQPALLGLLMSLVPCLPCTAIMACAVTSGDFIRGGLAAFFFAAGTAVSPLYLLGGGAGWLSGRIAEKIPENRNVIRYINGSVIAFMGIRILLSA